MNEYHTSASETGKLHSLIEPEWLEKHLGDSDLRVVDATVQVKLWPFPRVKSGRRGFERAHIPGAAFADLLKISDPQRPSYTFTMPTAERFADHMGRLGIGDGTRVIIYDARENMWAARLWWMLRAFGFDDAAVLNGGWTAWRFNDCPISSKPCHYPVTTFTPRMRPALIADKREVLSAIDDSKTCIVNALGRRQHCGERKEYGARGHIPGAKNVTAWEILDRKTMCYRPLEELRELFDPMLKAQRVITYCGGGIASSSDAFILHLLGHRNVAVYDGGLIEWSADRNLPLELGG